ncbi:unnamed protein product [Effrenium voratum]|uniref:Pentapeptide repeat-containing protein n=1 Tax=Effrenium voratum TaxID=2562239 RepID=A0AA36J4S9_9DINO|nr:unnamed protein product [Effrenium voratum]CAJ1449204.1 unnamed protein product [Effrenium voratum]
MADATRRPRRRLRLGLATVALTSFNAFTFLSVFQGDSGRESSAPHRRDLIWGLGAGLLGVEAAPREADAYMQRKVAYPPINRNDPDRCKFKTSNIAQANAQREKYLDLRECKMAGGKAVGDDIAGALMNRGDFTNANFENAIMTKVVAEDANFEGASFKNAVADRVEFKGANFKNAIFRNCLLTSSDFTDVNIENADFTDAFLDIQSVKILCNNPTMKGTNPVTGADTFLSAGCDIADAGSYNNMR